MNFLFDIAQEARSRAADRNALRAHDKAADAASGVADLQRRLDVLALANQALFEILKSRVGITEQEVLERMAQIDGRDGSRDGKMTPRVVSCPKCQRQVSTARRSCMFCGQAIPEGALFGKA